jgi:curved DNA-binding protein CbpA
MSTDALELAMALHQAPIQRFALRDRPLPENMGLALQIASATQPQLEEAATLFSEPQETVLEAVRFYLHQVLFEPGTDAYRVLGLAPDADSKQIRQHYILLQRWLHPDRRGEDWEAVFATKVNWAWQQLRNPKSREAYDGSHPQESLESAGELPDAGAIPLPAWSAAPVHRASRHWLRGITIGGLLLFCAGLFYLAVTRDDYLEADAPTSQTSESDASQHSAPITGAEGSRAANTGDPIFMAHSDPVPNVSDDSQSPKDAADSMSHADPAATDPAPSADSKQRTEPEPRGSTVAMASVRRPRAESGGEAGSSPQPAAGQPQEASGTRLAEKTRRNPETNRPPAQARDGSAALPSTASVSSDAGQISAASSRQTAGRDSPPAQAMAAIPEGVRDTSDPTAGATDAAPTTVVPDGDPVERFELARERLRSMLSYLRSRTSELPQWSDAPGQLTAARERDALHARNGQVDIDRFALDPPTWRMSDATVALEATYHVEANRTSAEKGRFYLDMAWRDGGWKITRIKMLPTP